MTARARSRKGVKWGGVVVLAALLTVWIASRYWMLLWIGGGGGNAAIGAGMVTAGHAQRRLPFPPGSSWSLQPMQTRLRWWVEWHFGPGGWYVTVPVWMLVVPVLAGTVWAWRLDGAARRRERVGRCPACGYDLRGRGSAAGSPCPECGRPVAGSVA